MISQLIQQLQRLRIADTPSEMRADYAYALDCCQFAATVGAGPSYAQISDACRQKIGELDAASRHVTKRYYREALLSFGLPSGREAVDAFGDLLPRLDYARLTASDLCRLHVLSPLWYSLRRRHRMEPCTRHYFWRIVNAMPPSPLAGILLLTECLEAQNHALSLGLPYTMGRRLDPINPAACSDSELMSRIGALTQEGTHLSREQLIVIADYVLTDIVAPGHTAEHIALVNAILNTGMPSFDYPSIARALEKTTLHLAKTRTASPLDLAPAYRTLWLHTLNPAYLRRTSHLIPQI